ncbi:establishment of cohesion [Anticarsia gemmatalis]|uniref:establishment of cohesion n=1 Tax=Anticarsia gemmatalis TaxID=129554 RepID=UPI003F75EC41
MAATTPRRSSRIPHTHTPKMSERKKGLFQSEEMASRESLTTHRRLPVVDSESDSEDCDLGIISTLDSSSGDENDQNVPKTPERSLWHETRSQTRKLLKENYDLKSFIKSPFTLKKYQTRYCPDAKCTGSISTPATPHLNNHPGTPSSTHSCASVHTTSSTSSRARKSLASLIADTESCSSSLKDLNFDTDSGTDSKENTPTKPRRSSRKKMTPKLQSFKGVLLEQKKNITPMKTAVVCLTKMDMSTMLSPTQMQKTPHNTTEVASPPKLHSRRSVIEIGESPESACDSEKSHKRLRNDSITDSGPHSKYPRIENAPKARLSLFNSDRLKEILSAKSFYGKSNPELNTSVTAKISSAIEASATHRRMRHSHSHRRKRKPGQINSGVKHRIRKPKIHKNKVTRYNNVSLNGSMLNSTVVSNKSASMNDTSMLSQNSSQELGNDKADPFDKEKQTIEALLSQWTEEDVPESELSFNRPAQELPCFNSTVIEETNQIFQPVTAVPVNVASLPQDSEAVIIELGGQKPALLPSGMAPLPLSVSSSPLPQGVAILPQTTDDVVMTEAEGHVDNHGDVPKSGQFLPVEGGYILVEENAVPSQEELPDLDEIERELRMLDEQILKMAETNNINAEAVLASTETAIPAVNNVTTGQAAEKADKPKLFPIFDKPNPGIATPGTKGTSEKNKKILKTGDDQYVIDAGQKKFGATQCAECGTIYQIGDPQDEHDHLVHHNATDVLRFNGWKDECIVDRSGTARCIRVRGGETGWKKVEQLLDRIVHPHLGYGNNLPKELIHTYTAYLYVDKKQIVGCLIVEPKLRAFKLIPGDPDCCSVEDYPVKCGVSRIWCHINHRRRGIAGRLLDCARASFLYGAALRVQDLAFSAPTTAGKAFATKYCGTENFYVYLD